MKIKSSRTNVRFQSKYRKDTTDIKGLTAHVFSAIVRQRKKHNKKTRVFTASLRDIEKALTKFNKKDIADPKSKLPLQYYEALSLFNKKLARTLPPNRPRINYAIEL